MRFDIPACLPLLRRCFAVCLVVAACFTAPRAAAGPSLITYGGDVVFGSLNTLTMELGGTARGTQYDALNVAGKLTFGGTLNVVLISAFSPALGDSFNLFDWGTKAGTFATVTLPALGPNLIWNTSQLYTTGTITVGTTLTPIEQWRQFYFGFSSNTGNAANLFNYDGDGVVNLIQYALGLNPLVPDVALLPVPFRTTVGPSQFLTITFSRPLSATDVNYLVEVSNDLAAWLPGSFYSSGGDVPSNANTTQVSRTSAGGVETITVRDNTAMAGTLTRFIRVSITYP